jgi:ATP-dependent Clp protease ATP-binding subunit ClpA
VQALKAALDQAVDRLPQVEGHGGDVQIGRDLTNLLNLTDKEAQKRGDQFIASEMFLLACATTRAKPDAWPSSTAEPQGAGSRRSCRRARRAGR